MSVAAHVAVNDAISSGCLSTADCWSDVAAVHCTQPRGWLNSDLIQCVYVFSRFGIKRIHHHDREVVAVTLYHCLPPQGWLSVCILLCVFILDVLLYVCC